MKGFLFFVGLSITLIACNRSFTFYDVAADQKKLTKDYTKEDPTIEKAIVPYRSELEESMNKVIVVSNADMTKAKPSSSLGNLLADATKEMASSLMNENIDIGIMNYGGIRVPGISAGNITTGNVYEIMPFDNYLVVLRLTGAQLQEVFDAIAAGGGWPVSGVNFKIKEGKAVDILIQSNPIEMIKIYSVAISDYLANGGDNMDMLKGLPQESTNILLRDAFMNYFRAINERGDKLELNNEIRISYE